MALHLVSARRLATELASRTVSPQDQAAYLITSFVVWLLPVYLFVMPPHVPDAWPIPYGLWFYELLILVAIYVFGTLHCLARCHVRPRENFLIDFSCLYAPISITSLLVVWGAFHVYATLVPWFLRKLDFDSQPAFLEFVYSARTYDLMRFFAYVGVTYFVFIRIGNRMKDISRLRLSASPTGDADAQFAAGELP